MKQKEQSNPYGDEIQIAVVNINRAFLGSGVELPFGTLSTLADAKTPAGLNRALSYCVSPRLVDEAVHNSPLT